MSKQGKRKITVDSKAPETLARPSVFQRLGTKKAAGKKAAVEREHCRQWAAHGVCAYGKACKFAVTHTLVSPSKRAASKEDANVTRLHSTVVRADELDPWDQSELEYADTDMLEKRRQQLQRELEREAGKTERNVKKKKAPSSSSSSRSSSSSSASTSSSGSTSSSSSGRDQKKGKKKLKRNSSSSSDDSPSKKKKPVKETARKGDKKAAPKKDEKSVKKVDTSSTKKKNVLLKMTLTKKAMSPVKKSSGTPPITNKTVSKSHASKHSKSPAPRRDKRSASPTSTKDKERDRQREKEKERDKDRERCRRSRSRKARSRSPRRSPRRKESADRVRVGSPKKSRRDPSPDKHRKSPARVRDRRDKERSLDRKKDDNRRKDDDREKLAARQRDRDRGGGKDAKRDNSKRGGGGGGGGGRDRREAKIPVAREADRREADRRETERREVDRGLAKPSKPMERLLPRPEERLAALAAISSRAADPDKSSTASKGQEDRGRKSERGEVRRDRSSKRDRTLDREHNDYSRSLDRGGVERAYERGHSLERPYSRCDRYEEPPREGAERSPAYRYDPAFDLPPHPRYPDDDERGYADHRDVGFEERRRRSWEGSAERERPPYHPHKEWEGDEFRAVEWRDRHWQHRDQQMGEFADAEREPGWHHRAHQPQGPHRAHGRMLADEGYGRSRPEHRDKRRPEAEPVRVRPEPEAAAEAEPAPDDLSEISDDPDDILDRDDMVERSDAESQPERAASEERLPHPNHAQEVTSSPRPEGVSKEDDDSKELDFEEISDGELEEERTKATLGSALGVDWASLVAEVSRSKAPAASTGAQRRWRPEKVFARLGVSVAMAGAQLAAEVAEAGDSEEEGGSEKPPAHPVASIQVAMERRRRQRAALFGSGCNVTRALSARRDLALRRHLCMLPPTERGAGQQRPSQLFQAARALLMQSG